ncbi:MAG: N-acetylmuramoyl-L-alanine amidase [Candidatus Gastranaerophilales bacterium]|nr:N-acetylmuramoyl-L-alanine amidase [Candidatus Gastranaerophilales bacterium]
MLQLSIEEKLQFIRLTVIIICFLVSVFFNSAFCAENYKIKDLIIDNSDRMLFIQAQGNYKNNQSSTYIPIDENSKSVKLLDSIATMTLNNPCRYVIDIPNAVLIGGNKEYNLENSKTIQNIKLSQFSNSPSVVRLTIGVNNFNDLSKFKIYSYGENIVIKYNNQIIDNSLQYKFYTPSGDMDKTAVNQNTGASVTNNLTGEVTNLAPVFQTKYYLSRIDQNSDGLILRGLGAISLQKTIYNSDNTKATLTLDNASVSEKLQNKTYFIPSSQKGLNTTLTINRLNSKKVQIILQGESLKDYRFVVSQDAQSMFISHRSYVLNTIFSANLAAVKSYNVSKTQAGYRLFDFIFDKGVTYDVFELGDNFYLDIDNLSDYNINAFENVFKNYDIKIQAMKIAGDKTRFIIPLNTLNFSYANIESSAKSIKLCFKEKPAVIAIAPLPQTVKKEPSTPEIIKQDEVGNINVTYIPKGEDEKKIKKPKKSKDEMTISAMRKVVLDPGHGGSDCGAIALENKYYEKTINLEVAKLIQEKLMKKDVYVYMTRTKDETLTLEDRVNYANEINPDIYVSIHANSTLQEVSYGLEVHYYKDDSIDLANTIHDNFANQKNLRKWETVDRGVIKSRFYVINHTEMPAVLIEMGFISNRTERDKLNTKERKEQIADSIAKGILEYLKVK